MARTPEFGQGGPTHPEEQRQGQPAQDSLQSFGEGGAKYQKDATPTGPGKLDFRRLLDALKPCPTLVDLVYDLMTDEELEQYADDLLLEGGREESKTSSAIDVDPKEDPPPVRRPAP